jgi:hypothetical protein
MEDGDGASACPSSIHLVKDAAAFSLNSYALIVISQFPAIFETVGKKVAAY